MMSPSRSGVASDATTLICRALKAGSARNFCKGADVLARSARMPTPAGAAMWTAAGVAGVKAKLA
jgi:hypothetical protein